MTENQGVQNNFLRKYRNLFGNSSSSSSKDYTLTGIGGDGDCLDQSDAGVRKFESISFGPESQRQRKGKRRKKVNKSTRTVFTGAKSRVGGKKGHKRKKTGGKNQSKSKTTPRKTGGKLKNKKRKSNQSKNNNSNIRGQLLKLLLRI